MSSSWKTEITAVFRKEATCEFRTKTGMVTSGVFSFATIVTVSLALFNRNPNSPDLQNVCASLIWTILLFSSLLSLPRTFLVEEEQATADLLRLTARPHAVFWGKLLFNLAQAWATATLVSLLFLGLTGLHVRYPGMYSITILGGSTALTGAVTLCGAIAAQASNRAALAGAIAIPLVLFPAQWGVSGLRASFGAGLVGGGVVAEAGLLAYAVLTIAVGPWIYAAIWKG